MRPAATGSAWEVSRPAITRAAAKAWNGQVRVLRVVDGTGRLLGVEGVSGSRVRRICLFRRSGAAPNLLVPWRSDEHPAWVPALVRHA